MEKDKKTPEKIAISVIGMGLGEAKTLILDAGYSYKIHSINGVRQEWAMDPNNLHTDSDIIALYLAGSTIAHAHNLKRRN